jgi:hypothetical protein
MFAYHVSKGELHMKRVALGCLLTCSMFGFGCALLKTEPPPTLPARLPIPETERREGDYRVEIRVMEMPAFLKSLLYSNPNLYADQVFNSTETQTVPLPVFHLQPGETKEADLRQSLAYPAVFDENGQATEYRMDVVGSYAKVKLRRDAEKRLILELEVEDTDAVYMREHTTPTGSPYARPVSNTLSVQAGGRVANLDEWTVLSGGSENVQRYVLSDAGKPEARTLSVWRVVLVRLSPPQ